MSYLPSPLKSPVAITIQPEPGDTAPRFPDCRICALFISQAAAVPPFSRQAMSLLLSPLKSWVATFDPPAHDAATVTAAPADGMPLATTKNVLAPSSVAAATLKLVETAA